MKEVESKLKPIYKLENSCIGKSLMLENFDKTHQMEFHHEGNWISSQDLPLLSSSKLKPIWKHGNFEALYIPADKGDKLAKE